MDSEETSVVISHLINDNFIMKADLPVVLPEENTELRTGKVQNRK
jgi:hypothetical protein